jgi:hypothetical protein
MLNFTRNALLNLTAPKQALEVSSEFQEFIPDSFGPLPYSGNVDFVRRVLIQALSGDRDLQAFSARQALQLGDSSELSVYLGPIRQVLTFPIRTDKHFTSGFTYVIPDVDKRLADSPELPNFFIQTQRTNPADAHRALIKLYGVSQSPVIRVGVVLTTFLVHAAKLAGIYDEG